MALDPIKRISRFAGEVELATARYWASIEEHRLCVGEHGQGMPQVRDWHWDLPP